MLGQAHASSGAQTLEGHEYRAKLWRYAVGPGVVHREDELGRHRPQLRELGGEGPDLRLVRVDPQLGARAPLGVLDPCHPSASFAGGHVVLLDHYAVPGLKDRVTTRCLLVHHASPSSGSPSTNRAVVSGRG